MIMNKVEIYPALRAIIGRTKITLPIMPFTNPEIAKIGEMRSGSI